MIPGSKALLQFAFDLQKAREDLEKVKEELDNIKKNGLTAIV